MKMMRIFGWFLMIGLIVPAGLAGIYTENFADYSGYDPYQSTAKWNVFDNRLEIHDIRGTGISNTAGLLDDGSGGYYEVHVSSPTSEVSVYLQHYNSEGYPVYRAPGVVLLSELQVSNMDVVRLSGGDILLVWVQDDGLNIMAQRFTTAGTAVWSAPVRINHTPVGTYIFSMQLTELTDDQAMVAFVDGRSATDRVYVQRIQANGSPAWADDKQVQNAIFATETSVRIGHDGSGIAIVAWQQDDGVDVDIAFTRVDMTGTATWDPALIANLDSTNTQSALNMVVSPGDGVYFSWREYGGAVSKLEMQKWYFNGTCPFVSDFTLVGNADNLSHASLHLLSTGNLLYMFSATVDYMNVMGTAVISPEFDLLTTPQILTDPTSFWYTGLISVGTSSSGGALVIWDALGDYVSEDRMMKVGNLGQKLWPGHRTVERQGGPPLRYYAEFTKNSGGNGGFSFSWTDNRAGDYHAFGSEYTAPRQPNQVARQFDSDRRILATKSAQAQDGTIAGLYVSRNAESVSLEVMWCTQNFAPLWTDAATVADIPFDISLTGLDIDIDSRGRAILSWAQNGSGSDQGVFFQAVTPDRQLVHAAPVRADSGMLAAQFRLTSIEPVGDGDAIVSWVDNAVGDFHVLAQRIGSNGSHVWPSLLQVTTIAPNSISTNELLALDDHMVAVYTVFNGTGYTVNRGEFSFDGSNLSVPSPVTDNYGYIFDCAADKIGDNVYLVWIGASGSGYKIFGQRLNDGLPGWIDKTFSDTTWSSIFDLDLLATDLNKLCYSMQGYQGSDRWSLIQEFDTSGNGTYAAEQIMISPEPVVYNFQYGISAQLNTGEDVHWASVAAADGDPRGGEIQYWLSNDGGTTWIQTELGLPVIFPSPGTDLRVSADLYAEPYQQVSPYVTSITTIWNESQVATDLVMNQAHYYEGDTFRLTLRHSNSGASVLVDKYMLLEVYGLFWYWPSWSESLDFRQDSITTGYTEDVIFEFPWPGDTGAATDLRFWAALLDPGTGELVGPYDYVTFGYGP